MKKVILSSLMFFFVLTGCAPNTVKETDRNEKLLTLQEAQTRVEQFLNENLMKPGQPVFIAEITEEAGLYKVVMDIGASEYAEAYFSRDGKYFFPLALDMAENEKQAEVRKKGEDTTLAQADMVLEKLDKPQVELFVMSYCPYGLQIEKGLLPVLGLLGDKIDFKLKFCGYAMHDKMELDENLKQYCIQKEEPDKLVPYLDCFLDTGDSEECSAVSGIDQAEITGCVTAADKFYKVTAQYNDQEIRTRGGYPLFDVNREDNIRHGVNGSPALIINGKRVSTGRDPASLLKIICSGFTEMPAECEESLPSATPSAGFGFDESIAGTTGSCE
jgi:glutaredoxin